MKLRNMTSVYIFNDDMLLLMKREGSSLFSKPVYCGIGGHFEESELNKPHDCCLRELYEEANIKRDDIDKFSLKYITIRRKNDEIRQQYIFFAELKNKNISLPLCDEGELRWIKTHEIFSFPMSVTNEKCLKHYFDYGKDDKFVYTASVSAENDIPCVNFTALIEFDTDYSNGYEDIK